MIDDKKKIWLEALEDNINISEISPFAFVDVDAWKNQYMREKRVKNLPFLFIGYCLLLDFLKTDLTGSSILLPESLVKENPILGLLIMCLILFISPIFITKNSQLYSGNIKTLILGVPIMLFVIDFIANLISGDASVVIPILIIYGIGYAVGSAAATFNDTTDD